MYTVCTVKCTIYIVKLHISVEIVQLNNLNGTVKYVNVQFHGQGISVADASILCTALHWEEI